MAVRKPPPGHQRLCRIPCSTPPEPRAGAYHVRSPGGAPLRCRRGETFSPRSRSLPTLSATPPPRYRAIGRRFVAVAAFLLGPYDATWRRLALSRRPAGPGTPAPGVCYTMLCLCSEHAAPAGPLRRRGRRYSGRSLSHDDIPRRDRPARRRRPEDSRGGSTVVPGRRVGAPLGRALRPRRAGNPGALSGAHALGLPRRGGQGVPRRAGGPVQGRAAHLARAGAAERLLRRGAGRPRGAAGRAGGAAAAELPTVPASASSPPTSRSTCRRRPAPSSRSPRSARTATGSRCGRATTDSATCCAKGRACRAPPCPSAPATRR